eukprot:Gb_35965 [translate_table: standard]
MQGVGIVGINGVLNSASGVTAACDFSRKFGSSASGFRSFMSLEPKFGFSNGFLKHFPSISAPSHRWRQAGLSRSRTNLCARAVGRQDGTLKPIAPLQLESPTGQFLSEILKSHPHLLPAAVEQQLERLLADRDAADQQEQPSSTGTELVLYRRIAEMKAAERRKALEEIIYALVVQKFMDAGVSLIPTISTSADAIGKVDTWPNQDKQLETVHSPEAFEMIRNHLTLVLGNRLLDSSAIAQISKLRVGQVYAASVMYGYFLRRVDQRFQLEKSMKMLPFGLNEEVDPVQSMDNYSKTEGETWPGFSSAQATSGANPRTPADPDVNPSGFGGVGIKPCKLRAYVISFDPETLQRYATMRSKEGVSIIEKHSEALFGKPEGQIAFDGSVGASNDEMIRISFSGLTGLVLEAVTFGSFLWDVESYVDSRYHFVTN